MENAVKTYTFNLRDDIGHYVIPNQPDTLLKAQNLASEIEMHVREREEMERWEHKRLSHLQYDAQIHPRQQQQHVALIGTSTNWKDDH